MSPADLSALTLLQEQPHGFSLFAALRVLEQLHADKPRLGESRKAADDAVRLGQAPHLAFAASPRREDGLELAGEAADTDQAIQMALRRRPHVVLLDVDMPGGGGVRAAVETGDLSLKMLSFQLGFSEPSAFYRACKRWFGMAPSDIVSLAHQEGIPVLVDGAWQI